MLINCLGVAEVYLHLNQRIYKSDVMYLIKYWNCGNKIKFSQYYSQAVYFFFFLHNVLLVFSLNVKIIFKVPFVYPQSTKF